MIPVLINLKTANYDLAVLINWLSFSNKKIKPKLEINYLFYYFS
jgi:hypothetical protein